MCKLTKVELDKFEHDVKNVCIYFAPASESTNCGETIRIK